MNTRRKILSLFGLGASGAVAAAIPAGAAPISALWMEQKEGKVAIKGRANGKEFVVFRFDESLLSNSELVGLELIAQTMTPVDRYTGIYIAGATKNGLII